MSPSQLLPNIKPTTGRPSSEGWPPPVIKPNLNLLPEMGIAPSQAAAIAQADYPGSKVLKVRQRGGIYVVTLVFGGNVIRVRVDGTYGSIL